MGSFHLHEWQLPQYVPSGQENLGTLALSLLADLLGHLLPPETTVDFKLCLQAWKKTCWSRLFLMDQLHKF